MTSPNVEYWIARAEISDTNNLEAKTALNAQMMKHANNDELFDVLVNAHGRLTATQSLVMSLLEQIKNYEERIALLK